MAETLDAIRVQANLTATVSNSLDGGNATASAGQGFSVSNTFANGTAANQADKIWSDNGRTITSGSSENLDLYDLAAFDIGAGAGKDALGQAWTAAEVVGLLIENDSTSAGNLVVGGEGSGAAWNSLFNGSDTAKIEIFPGGFFMVTCPPATAYAVADSTNHLLKLAASGGNVTYCVTVLARSA